MAPGIAGRVTTPKRVSALVTVKLGLHLLRDRLIFGHFRAAFDLGFRQRDNELLPLEVLLRKWQTDR